MNFRKSLMSAAFCAAALGPALAAAQEPATPEMLAEAYENGRWSSAIMLAEELLKAEPENVSYLTILGVSATNINDFKRAEDVFEKAEALRPDAPLPLLNLGGARIKLKRENALDTCLKAAEKNPDNAELWQIIGQEYENGKRLDDARNAYLKACQIDPKNVAFITSVTAIDFSRKDYASALDISEKAIEGGNENVILYLNAILAANRSGAYEKALSLANRGYEKHHDPLRNLGKAEALNSLHRFEEALPVWKALLEEIKKSHQNYPRIQYGCARALLATSCDEPKYAKCGGDAEDACCAREHEALELLVAAKDDKVLRKSSPEYDENLGLAYILNNKLEDAEAVLTAAVTNDLKKNSAGAPAALAVALYSFSDAQDRNAARVYYQQAVNASDDVSDPDRFVTARAWPQRLAGTLKKLKAEADAQKASKTKAKCSCDISANAPASPLAAGLGALLACLGLCLVRRRSL